MKIQHLLIGVLFSCLITFTTPLPLVQGKTISQEQMVTVASGMWAGIVVVDFSTDPPTVFAISADMSQVGLGNIPLEVFEYGESLALEQDLGDRYIYALPKQCGGTHFLAGVVVLKTGNVQDVGFEMKPIGDKGCVIVPQAVRYDNQSVRDTVRGREAYRFSLDKKTLMLLPSDVGRCGVLPTIQR
ncbi:MAG: hypothetical protein ABIJ23_00100 [Candidatus Magasanikbacteria bacterium]